MAETMTEARTILVAGATGSIGAAAASALARRGAKVVLLGRRSDRLSARAELMRAASGEERAHPVTRTSTRWSWTSPTWSR